MTDTPTQPPAPVAAPSAPAPADDDGKGGKSAVLADLATERDKRQALEQQVQQMQQSQQATTEALAKAFGLKPEETSDLSALAAQVTGLQEQFMATQHDNTVLLVAREAGITEQADIELLKSIKDDKTMRALASRIAASTSSTPGQPKPDLTQGGGAGGKTPASTPAQDFANFLQRQG